ncbi:hypothetical protein NPIL_229031 [Nephila pilipes]|uniref:Uncharacterized protein n=1 Tax=Nephila pilipes TaxID=299642 RepID=A0A8X6P3T7_NEPPI|nr:hypothetical protein NPIL_229031 [Nephila pilipes]
MNTDSEEENDHGRCLKLVRLEAKIGKAIQMIENCNFLITQSVKKKEEPKIQLVTDRQNYEGLKNELTGLRPPISTCTSYETSHTEKSEHTDQVPPEPTVGSTDWSRMDEDAEPMDERVVISPTDPPRCDKSSKLVLERKLIDIEISKVIKEYMLNYLPGAVDYFPSD